MRKLHVRLLARANADLKAINDWIVAASGGETVAEKFINRIYDRCNQLSDFPEIGVLRTDLAAGIRLLVFEKRASIFYFISDDEVVVTRILYRGRDYDETTFED